MLILVIFFVFYVLDDSRSQCAKVLSVSVQTVAMETTYSREDFNHLLQSELEKAKDKWRASLHDDANISVTAALEKAQGNFTKILEREKMAAMDKMKRQCDKEMEQQLKKQAELLRKELEEEFSARLSLLDKEKQETLQNQDQYLKDKQQVNLEERKELTVHAVGKECSLQQGSTVEDAIQCARQKWEEFKETELLKMHDDHQRELKEKVRKAVGKAKKHYEGVCMCLLQ